MKLDCAAGNGKRYDASRRACAASGAGLVVAVE